MKSKKKGLHSNLVPLFAQSWVHAKNKRLRQPFVCSKLQPNLQRGGACRNFAYFVCQLYYPGDPKGGVMAQCSPLKYAPVREAEAARQFNSFNDFWIFAFYCSSSYGFKNVRNVIEMALKLVFLPQTHKNCPAAGGSVPPGPSVIRLSCISLFSTGPKLENFCAKKFCF